MLMHSAPPRHEASSAEFIEILPEAPFTGAEVQDLTEILPPPRHKASSARFIGGSAKNLAFGEFSDAPPPAWVGKSYFSKNFITLFHRF